MEYKYSVSARALNLIACLTMYIFSLGDAAIMGTLTARISLNDPYLFCEPDILLLTFFFLFSKHSTIAILETVNTLVVLRSPFSERCKSGWKKRDVLQRL